MISFLQKQKRTECAKLAILCVKSTQNRRNGMNLMFMSLLPVLVVLYGCSNNNITNNENGRLLLEDCEDKNSKTAVGSYWYITTDTSKGGESSVYVSRDADNKIRLTGNGYQSERSFKMVYKLEKGEYAYKPFVICGFRLSSDVNSFLDARRYEGISYFYKGPAHSVRVETRDVTDFCYHSFSVPASDDWKKITIPFTKLKQDSWGEQITFDKSSLKGVSWQISGNDNDSSIVYIDDVFLEEEIISVLIDDNEFIIYGNEIAMHGTLYKPEKDGVYPLIIVLPGGTSASNIGKVYGHHKHFGELFLSRGFAVLVLDYSSNSRSFFDTLQIEDISKAVDYCKNMTFVNKDKMFLVGFSIGGANALRVGGSRNDIAGLVCYFAPSDWSVTGTGYGVRKQPVEYCGSITCPVLIIQGDSDKVTLPSQSRLLYDSLLVMGKEAELVIYEGASHGFTYEGAPAGNCLFNREIAELSYSKVEKFLNDIIK